MASERKNGAKLKMITYLHPGLPLGLFQSYQYYLEDTLQMHSQLVVESRWSCPPSDRPDPFTKDEVDIAFMCSSGFLGLVGENNQYMELCKAAPVFQHPNNPDQRPIYFTDVIVRKERAEDYKEFVDLKGHRWAVNDQDSLSGNIATLVQLKRLGFDTNFFGDILYSGSHHKSIDMVVNGIVDGAAVDSNVLQQLFIEKSELKSKVTVVCSWGPLPIYPVILNSRLSDELKQTVTQAFLEIHKSVKYQAALKHYGVVGFVSIEESLYDKEKELKQVARGLKSRAAYY